MTQIANVAGASAPAAAAGVSGVSATSDYTPSVTLESLSTSDGSTPTARISIDDSPDGVTWTPYVEFSFAGQCSETITMSTRSYAAAGGLKPHVRANLLAINGTASYIAQI